MTTTCITGIAYALPARTHDLAMLAAAGALESDPALLASFGFATVPVAERETPYALALAAARRLLAESGVAPASVDALLYAGAPAPIAYATPAEAAARAADLTTTHRFDFPASRLQHELGLERATVLGIDQLACAGLFAAVRVARALCAAEGAERVLCVASEFFPARAGREAVFNCTADAACALLVERGGARNRVRAAVTVSKGWFGEGALREQLVASYFPTAREVMRRTLCDAGWDAGDVDWVIPHNVSRRSWEILLRLAALPRARLWDHNIARRGHALAGDNFMNLRDAIDAGDVRPGERVLLFSYGYGAHWTALALEV